MNKKSIKIKEKISETLELPKDIVMDLPKITIIGNNQINIENHKGLIEYGDTIIRINSGGGIVTINGCELFIKCILPEEIIVSGEVTSINF